MPLIRCGNCGHSGIVTRRQEIFKPFTTYFVCGYCSKVLWETVDEPPTPPDA